MSDQDLATRTEDQVRAELDLAYQNDRKYHYGTPKYYENSLLIGRLIRELKRFLYEPTGTFSCEDYDSSPDSFEQSAINRERGRSC